MRVSQLFNTLLFTQQQQEEEEEQEVRVSQLFNTLLFTQQQQQEEEQEVRVSQIFNTLCSNSAETVYIICGHELIYRHQQLVPLRILSNILFEMIS